MTVAQMIKVKTSKYDELDQAHDAWKKATEGERTVTRELICENRDAPGEYWIIVEFPSVEAARQNNELPATGRIALEMAKLAEGEPEYVNLDVRRMEEAED